MNPPDDDILRQMAENQLFFEGEAPPQNRGKFGDKSGGRKPSAAPPNINQTEDKTMNTQTSTASSPIGVRPLTSEERDNAAAQNVEAIRKQLEAQGSWKKTAVDAGVTAAATVGLAWASYGVYRLFAGPSNPVPKPVPGK